MKTQIPNSRHLLTLGFAAIAAVWLSSQSALAQNSASVVLSGTVGASAKITATTAPQLTSAELVDGVTDKLVSTVNEKCNNHNGYTVTLQSVNAAAASSSQARLKGGRAGNTDVINYSIKYNGAAITLDNTGTATVTNSDVKTGGSGVDKPLAITIAGGQNPSDDLYVDQLVLQIAVK